MSAVRGEERGEGWEVAGMGKGWGFNAVRDERMSARWGEGVSEVRG